MKFIHQFRIIIIALISFLVITSGVFLRKTISFFLCGILSFNSASCYSFFDKFNAEAAPPPSSTVLASKENAITQKSDPKGLSFFLVNPFSPSNIVVAQSDKKEEEKCTYNIFIGGANDSNITQVKSYYESFKAKNTQSNNFYEYWGNGHSIFATTGSQVEAIGKKIKTWPQESIINVIGHSWGGDTAAFLVANITKYGREKVNLLITVDPVSRWKPTLKDVKSHTNQWINVLADSTHTHKSGGNIVAGIGGDWGTEPKKYVDNFIVAKGINHEDFKALMQYGSVGSAENILNQNQKPCPKKVSHCNPQQKNQISLTNTTELTSSAPKSYQKQAQQQPECPLTQGISTGDPHLGTFDGLRYDLQTVGEFILIKSNDGEFEVQARQTAFKNSTSLSLNSAVAMRAGSDRVAFYAQGFPDADTSTPLRVNGKSTTIQGDKLALKGGGEILKQGNTYFINFPTGEKAVVTNNDGFLNISPSVYKQYGQYSGLLGNVNGNPNDDQQIRGKGNVLKVQSTYGDVKNVLNGIGLRLPGVLDRGEQIYFNQLYKEFGNSWRVKQEESLFDYPSGKTTQNYTDRSFPDKYLKLDMLSTDQIQKARNACTEAKVTEDLMEGCIFDVGFSGLSEFARATAEINSYIDLARQLGIKLPKITPPNIIPPNIIPPNIIPKIPKVCLPVIGCN